MKKSPLTSHELALIQSVLARHQEVVRAIVFGSRAKGTHTDRSDVDLSLLGPVTPLQAEALAAELDELPLPLLFDVNSFEHVGLPALREHIERVGIEIYPNYQGAGAVCLKEGPLLGDSV